MRKILIISFYELKDYFLNIECHFNNKYKWDVVHYPLYMYCYDKNSKIDKYETHFSDFIKKEAPDIILWWFIDVSLSVFKKIKDDHPNIFYIMFNQNDPLNMNRSLLEISVPFRLSSRFRTLRLRIHSSLPRSWPSPRSVTKGQWILYATTSAVKQASQLHGSRHSKTRFSRPARISTGGCSNPPNLW